VGSSTIVSGASGTIAVTVPSGTNVTALVATFTTSANIAWIKVGGTAQESGTTPNNFSSPVTYVVTAQDGVTTKSWVVTVSITPPATYVLTMAVSPSGEGTATDKTGNSPYTAGAQVSIQAVANAGYQFVNWTAPSGTITSATSATTTFTMPGNAVTVTANFKSIGITSTTTTTSGTNTVKVTGTDAAPTITFTAPSGIDLNNNSGMMVTGWNAAQATNSGSVTLTEGTSGTATYTVTAESTSPYMNNGSVNLQNYLLIGNTSLTGGWFIANGGTGVVPTPSGITHSGVLTYNGSTAGTPVALPFFAAQYVTPTDALGIYTDTITFTASCMP
jgi:uncharacterized repeat protein (TIGR02543 family)